MGRKEYENERVYKKITLWDQQIEKMPSRCIFNLEQPNEIYHAGVERVKGVVTLTTSRDKNIKQIKIRFKGVTKCGFIQLIQVAEGEPRIAIPNVYYTSKDRITKFENVVHGPGVLPAGTYTWPFDFEVIERCPTSMEGPCGHIRYQLSLKIYNENKYNNLFIKPVTVIKIDDLNAKRDLYKVQVQSVARSFNCCGLFPSGAFFRITIQFGGYAPAQWARYALDVYNKSPEKQYTYEIRFVRKTKYKAALPTKCVTYNETVLSHENRVGEIGDTESFLFAFYIPATPPTTKTKYISVDYVFRITLKVECCSQTLRGELPVPIGTVPIKDSLSRRQRDALVEKIGTGFKIRTPGFERPDPSDTTFIDLTTDRRNRDDTFMPYYPMYKIVHSI